ncbi:ABC transporter substrate-binding protein (plasmid) [Methylocystis sp. MJC1]|jgi:NitT/TauT family transport system ATP-binding protein|uniref:CmpA/NrtA family ABC transporter substrate-binding protein n=1 Tax=Methylocystis sp. MJC1 TaxID=2654282 RepID=UPI0013EC38EA|nr:CmpA/NrtA family ABC transporter substrate-binding protein [Methylocystis sp. MJC1]KAF2989084.1 Bicarbonate transport ATP-binding protein CmpC [Methylocystis sp. MJC1]MBU6529137.1 ABC transporter substrate-binding protein [Methylocystis sp. MJC1]UZX14070.1 ABC transporter substrate-binding protein [Methylocystis sp. MJC1]
MNADRKIKVGFIPLADAASLFVAVDKGFAAAEGLDIELVREVSWSNVRDRLAIGHYDAAHLLAPMAIASTLGLSHVRAPVIAAMNLAMNGNAITISPDLHASLVAAADGDLGDPLISARALKAVVASRQKRNAEPLTFGMTFPFSTHNYQLRYWMAEGGVDPDSDVQLVVLPPPYMVENLAKGHVDGFCVGAPWNAVAEGMGIGVILHPGPAIFHPAPEKTLAFRRQVADSEPQLVEALIRACLKAGDYIRARANREEVAALLARPDRVGSDIDSLRRALDGRLLGNAETTNYLIFGDYESGRPDASQAAWLYAQMRRWGQADRSEEALRTAQGVFTPAFFNAATRLAPVEAAPIVAFSGPVCDAGNIEGYLNSFAIRSAP